MHINSTLPSNVQTPFRFHQLFPLCLLVSGPRPIQEHVLPVVVKSFQLPSAWNNSALVLPCQMSLTVLRRTGLSFCRVIFLLTFIQAGYPGRNPSEMVCSCHSVPLLVNANLNHLEKLVSVRSLYKAIISLLGIEQSFEGKYSEMIPHQIQYSLAQYSEMTA